MRTYLVTGGAGFIGSNYIHYMFRKYDNEIRIINVDALTYAGNLENLKDIENRDNYTFVKADITDKEAIRKVFAENDIDRVVHFAAESHVDRSIKNPEVFVHTNVMGTAVMLNCAKEAWELPDGSFKEGKKFLHVSTDEVYGSLPDDGKSFFYETTPYQPHSPYSASKASSDMLVKAYMDTYHFPANITNCSNNYHCSKAGICELIYKLAQIFSAGLFFFLIFFYCHTLLYLYSCLYTIIRYSKECNNFREIAFIVDKAISLTKSFLSIQQGIVMKEVF